MLSGSKNVFFYKVQCGDRDLRLKYEYLRLVNRYYMCKVVKIYHNTYVSLVPLDSNIKPFICECILKICILVVIFLSIALKTIWKHTIKCTKTSMKLRYGYLNKPVKSVVSCVPLAFQFFFFVFFVFTGGRGWGVLMLFFTIWLAQD